MLVVLALRSQKENKEMLAVACISTARMHRLGFTARATQWNNGQPYGQLFHFACNNWRRAGKSEEGEAREAKCLLCARRSSLIKSRWPNDERAELR